MEYMYHIPCVVVLMSSLFSVHSSRNNYCMCVLRTSWLHTVATGLKINEKSSRNFANFMIDRRNGVVHVTSQVNYATIVLSSDWKKFLARN